MDWMPTAFHVALLLHCSYPNDTHHLYLITFALHSPYLEPELMEVSQGSLPGLR